MPRRRRPPRAGALTELPPLRIVSQIAAIQALYYAVALVLISFTALTSGIPFHLDLVLGWESVRGDTTQGWLFAFTWVLNGGLCMAIAIIVLVSRSKLVPDFALTLHFVHLVVTSLYVGRVPTHALWWLATAASSGLAVVAGVWGCRYRELQPIMFGGSGSSRNNAHAKPNSSASDPEMGIGLLSASVGFDTDGGPDDGGAATPTSSRGRGRGRGEFEMVRMGAGAPS